MSCNFLIGFTIEDYHWHQEIVCSCHGQRPRCSLCPIWLLAHINCPCPTPSTSLQAVVQKMKRCLVHVEYPTPVVMGAKKEQMSQLRELLCLVINLLRCTHCLFVRAPMEWELIPEYWVNIGLFVHACVCPRVRLSVRAFVCACVCPCLRLSPWDHSGSVNSVNIFKYLLVIYWFFLLPTPYFNTPCCSLLYVCTYPISTYIHIGTYVCM